MVVSAMRGPGQSLADAVELSCACFASDEEGWFDEVFVRHPKNEWLIALSKLAALLATWRAEQTTGDPERYLRSVRAAVEQGPEGTIEQRDKDEAIDLAVSMIPSHTDAELDSINRQVIEIIAGGRSGAVFMSLVGINWTLLGEHAARAFGTSGPEEVRLDELGPWLDGLIESFATGKVGSLGPPP